MVLSLHGSFTDFKASKFVISTPMCSPRHPPAESEGVAPPVAAAVVPGRQSTDTQALLSFVSSDSEIDPRMFVPGRDAATGSVVINVDVTNNASEETGRAI
jgi:hypothetical protein